jgi:signal transduction histidine kinase
LRADPDRLTQVVINLLANAAKFMPERDGRVDIVLSRSDQGVQVAIQDNGPGVPASQRSQIFEKFHQAQDSGVRPQGTGLGLPISRQIVEHLGGHIWVEAAPAGGARFVFELPWNTMAEETADPVDTPYRDIAHSPQAPS